MEQFFEVLNMVADTAGVVGAIISVLIWLQVRNQKNVVVELIHNNVIVLSFEVPRVAFSRAELLGRLGIYAKVPRFVINSLSTVAVLKEIDDATLGKDRFVRITLEDGEENQF